MVKVWYKTFTEKTYTEASIENIRDFMNIPLTLGQPLAGRFPENTTLLIRSAGEPLDFFQAGTMNLVSERLKAVLGQFDAAVEWFPVTLIGRRRRTFHSRWFHMNILTTVDGVDWENCEVVPSIHSGGSPDIVRLALLEKPVGAYPLFRLAGTSPKIICVSDDMAEAITKEGCTGVEFKRPEDWRNPLFPS